NALPGTINPEAIMNGFRSISIFLTIAIFAVGCSAPQQTANPLAGWKHSQRARLDKAIIEDYQSYIEKLPPEERNAVTPNSVEALEDGLGGHAVRIEAALRGTFWDHVLIYDRDNKRVKTAKYVGGHYRS